MSRVYFEDRGHGLPVVLIHGFCETHTVWAHLADQLAITYRVITIDLPGFGNSIFLPAPHALDDAADWVSEFLTNDLKLESSVVLGHSLGGYIVLAIADKHPERCSAIGLINSTAFADTQERKLNRNKVIDFISRHGANRFVRSFIPPLFYSKSNAHIAPLLEHGANTTAQTLIAYTEAMRERPDRTHVLKAFTKPILFLTGKEDGLIPAREVEHQATLAKYPTLHIVDNAAHMSFLDNEEDATRIIRKFLASIA